MYVTTRRLIQTWTACGLLFFASWQAIAEDPGATSVIARAVEPSSKVVPASHSTGLSSIQLFDVTRLLPSARKLHPAIYQASGVSNTTMVTTSEGNVVIDTSLAQTAGLHRRSLRRVNSQPVRYIILTHAHKDHTGGISTWKEPDTEIIAHKNCVEFLNYQSRLAEFFSRRNSAQFAVSLPLEEARGNFAAKIDASILFEKEHHFELGGIDFHLYHTPGETYDHVSVWIPQYKAAFVGDNYYRSFPNLYTPRGTKPRWALDYVRSLDQVISWKPEILVSGHSPPILGREQVAEKLTRYRDAILYVHDATVAGMNKGKTVHELMREIKLPQSLRQNEKYGSVKWSVRGIYEGYAGWFDGNPASMYDRPVTDAYPALLELAGGAAVVTHEAEEKLAAGQLFESLHLADMVLAVEEDYVAALIVRRTALKQLLAKSTNAIESGWLLHGIRDATGRIKQRGGEGMPPETRFTAAE